MKSGDDSGGEFPATRWTWLAEAGGSDPGRRAEAVERLLRTYYPVLKNHLRSHHRMAEADAEDCLQEFMVDKVMGRELLARADRARGRFRTFICHALGNFVLNRHRRQMALKRAPEQAAVSLDGVPEADVAASHECSGDESFDREFFEEVVRRALQRMKARCLESNRGLLWELLENRVLEQVFEGRAPVPYSKLVPLLELESADEAANLLVNAKRMFARCVRSVVREYAAEDGEVAEELRELKRRLGEEPEQFS